MALVLPQLDNSEYAVGWIAALPHERAAAEALLDHRHAPPQNKHTKDDNIYSLGSIDGPNGEHNVVIAGLPPGRYGTTPAATAAAQMLSSFPAIKFGLMVGIGGGIPSNDNDIRLGDVVVSKPEGTFGGVRQYGVRKATDHGFEERGSLNSPPRVLLNAMGALQSKHERELSAIPSILEAMYKENSLMAKPRQGPGYIYQGTNNDRLFHPDYAHSASKKDCSECDSSKELAREGRSDQDPYIFYGTIASGDEVVKDARQRDLFLDCLCFETEAAGLVNDFPCLVIRGICDYSDTHKNDRWQRYAAATAAAYAKELLQITDAAEVQSSPEARKIMHELQEIKSDTNKIVLNIKQQHLDRKRERIFQWLSPLSPSARHSESREQRVEGTGIWLLEDPKFFDWSSEIPKFQTLCCYGDPGVGKTVISALVIDELKKRAVSRPEIGLGFIYCDYRDQEEQTTENVLGAMLKQLLERLSEIPERVLTLYEERTNHGKQLSSTDATDLLRMTCSHFSKIYLILDALDELKPRDLWGLLKCFRDGSASIQIFITGRPHVGGTIREYLKTEQSITIEARESDIQRFIEYEIGGPNDIEPKAMDKQLRTEILKKIVDSAKGMLVRAILQATTIRDREESLKTLPSDLGEAFAGTMTRIERQVKELSERAGKIIAWTHFAERSLTIDELLCLLAIRDGDTSFNSRGIPVRETLLNCCHGLVVIDQETSTVRLVHYSLDEHLREQNQILGLTKAQWHSKIARTCLTFLKFPSVSAREVPEQNHRTTRRLLSYAATKWGHHLRRSEGLPDAPLELAKEYLNTGLANNVLSFRLFCERMDPYLYTESLFNDVLPVHIVAFFGILRIMVDPVSTAWNLDIKDGNGRTPL
ncbi:hypothetical protein AJ79_10258, partial [Helicocarpus griseus UAMH5409]